MSDAPLLLLHAGASSSTQWAPFRRRLGQTHRVLAPDLHGHGETPAPPNLALDGVIPAQVADLLPLLDTYAKPADVVGHSYGGAIALFLALAAPGRVRSLLLIEPPLFTLLDQPDDAPLLDEIRSLEAENLAALDRGDAEDATKRFVRYWSGDALWHALPDAFRAPLYRGAELRHRRGIAAMFVAALPDDVGERLRIPVTLLTGTRSPAPARRITERLANRLPTAHLVTIADAGHMLPGTHAREFVAALQIHLAAAR